MTPHISGEHLDYAKELWGLSSAIVAFCFLQTLTFLYNFQKPAFRKQVVEQRHWIPLATLVATGLYVGAIGRIEYFQYMLIDQDALLRQTVDGIAILKIAAVTLCGIIAFIFSLLREKKKQVAGASSLNAGGTDGGIV